MKVLDYAITALFVVAFGIICYMQKCGLDTYFLVLGFVIAMMCALTLFLQKKGGQDKEVHAN